MRRKIPDYFSVIYIRSKKTVKNNIGPLLVNGDTINDHKGTASVLNSIFSSVFTKENMTSIPAPRTIFHGPEEHKLALTEIDISKMCAYLQKNILK